MRVFENFILGPEKSSFCSAHFQESGKIYFINFGVRLDFLLFIFLRARPFKKKIRSALGQRPKPLAAGRPRGHSARAPGSRRFLLLPSPSRTLVLCSFIPYLFLDLFLLFPNPSLFLVPYPKQNPPLPNINTQAPPLQHIKSTPLLSSPHPTSLRHLAGVRRTTAAIAAPPHHLRPSQPPTDPTVPSPTPEGHRRTSPELHQNPIIGTATVNPDLLFFSFCFFSEQFQSCKIHS